jgi:hypothetical protein
MKKLILTVIIAGFGFSSVQATCIHQLTQGLRAKTVANAASGQKTKKTKKRGRNLVRHNNSKTKATTAE